MAKIMSDLSLQLSADTAELKKGLKRANKQISGFKKMTEKRNKAVTNSFKKMGGIVAGVFAVKEIVRFGKEAVQLAAKVKGVRFAFEKLENSTKILRELKKATNGTVTELELMRQAVRAQNFDIPMKLLAKGLEFAKKQASATGESVDFLVNSFVTGLGRKSVLILDNLGISAVQLNEEIKKTGDFMTAVANITDTKLKGMGDQMESEADKMAQIKVQWEEMKLAFGEALLKGIVPLIGGVRDLGRSLKEGERPLKNQQEKMNDLVGTVLLYNTGTEQRKTAMDNLKKAYPDYFGNLDSEKTKNEDLVKVVDAVNEAYARRIVIAQYTKELNALERQENRLERQRVRNVQGLKTFGEGLIGAGHTIEEYIEATEKRITQDKELQKMSEKDRGGRGFLAKGLVKGLESGIKAIEEYPGKYDVLIDKQKFVNEEMEEMLRLLGLTEKKIDVLTGGDGSNGGGGVVKVEALMTIFKLQEKIGQLKERQLHAEGAQLESLNRQIAWYESRIDKLNKAGTGGGVSFKPAGSPGPSLGQTGPQTLPLIPGAPISGRSSMDTFKDNVDLMGDNIDDFLTDNQAAIAASMESIANLMGTIGHMQKAAMDKELKMAGDNEEKKEQIRKKYAKKQKALAISQAIVQGGLAFVQALASAPAPFNLILAGSIAAVTAAQIGMMVGTPLAAGGIAYGPTQALVGEYPGARTNPEVIAPLNKLQNMIGGKGTGEVVFRINGTELIGVLNNNQIKNNAF